MTAPTPNTVAWFQIGSDNPEQVKSFYADLFGWSYLADPDFDGNYDMVTYPGNPQPRGGIARTPDSTANHAIFYVLVTDVAATIATAEKLGAKIEAPLTKTPSGLIFAELRDTSGNHFGVFTPPPA
ncbi:VOC family protein [Nocardia sp. SYP-A9097]|uniref:VOC family protein n=1 Tax=Nocardia sp. SYP-A9097 TaxID=2663237 RepID=UPI00129B1213|nr:VOC family protein [Nocardia sp. SYP-A9097]MRH88297.1 VOC family protein [Nocardia sp. SYP-A9097]